MVEKNYVEYLKMTVNEISKLPIDDSDIAEIKRQQLRAAIYPVMKAFLLSGLSNNEETQSLLLKAVKLEDQLAIKHAEFVENGN